MADTIFSNVSILKEASQSKRVLDSYLEELLSTTFQLVEQYGEELKDTLLEELEKIDYLFEARREFYLM